MASWDFRPHGTIVDGETFACVTELQMRQAARLQYAVSMLTIHQSGNGYVADPGDGAQELAEVVSPLIRDTDLIEAVPAAGTVRVLLVGGELEDIDIIIRRIITEVSHHRFDERHALVVRIGGSCFPATAGNSRDLKRQADTLAEEARRAPGAYSTYRLRTRSET